MRRALVLMLLLLSACAVAHKPAWERLPPPARDAPVVQDGSLQRADLDNGLEVLVLEDRRLPRVALGVTVRRGAAIVGNEQAGLAAFSAELMRRGAGGRDALALAQAVDEIGASLRVGSDWDEMSVWVTGLSRDLDRLLEILADVALRPRFETREGGTDAVVDPDSEGEVRSGIAALEVDLVGSIELVSIAIRGGPEQHQSCSSREGYSP
jgi:zinc protease